MGRSLSPKELIEPQRLMLRGHAPLQEWRCEPVWLLALECEYARITERDAELAQPWNVV